MVVFLVNKKKMKILLPIICVVILSGILILNRFLYIKANALSNIGHPVIVIDPGHGGVDPGAVGPSSVLEKDINLKIALKLYTLIEEWGGTAFLTRDKDIGLYEDNPATSLRKKKQEDLINRIKKANSAGGNVLLSIHMNAHPSPQWHGAQVFYHKNSKDGEKLAKIIQEELIRVLDKANKREAKKASDYYILNKSYEMGIVAVIIETGFLSNPQEEYKFTEDEHQEKAAWAIFTGLIRYLFESENIPKDINI